MIFERNSERMPYARYRAEKLFVGSGVVEAGCKTVIGRRLRMSGMFWTVRGANSLIALRCNRISGKFTDYWESSAARALQSCRALTKASRIHMPDKPRTLTSDRASQISPLLHPTGSKILTRYLLGS